MKMTRMLILFTSYLFCSLFFLPAAFAQTEKGSLLLGGNAGMNFSSQPNNKHFSASVSPRVGVFVANRLALGATVPVNYSSSEINSFRYFNIGIGPFVRYYMGAGKAVPFLEARGGLNFSRYRYEEPGGIERKETQNYRYGGLGLGLAYFITPSIGLESILSYDANRSSSSNSMGSNTSGQLNLNIGFQIYFSRNQE
jgi:hypothetical protein